MDNHDYPRGPGQLQGAEPAAEGRRGRGRLGLLAWLGLALLSGCLLFTCAQVAGLQLYPETSDVSIESMLEADYGPWRYTSFAPINPDILIDIMQDLQLAGAIGPASVGDCLIPGTCPEEGAPGPTATETLTPTPSLSPTASGTPTQTATPSATFTPSDTATITPTATNTPTPTPLVYPVKLADPSKLDPTQKQTIQFTIYVINYGSEPPAELTTVCDFLPSGFDYVAGSASPSATTGTCPEGDRDPSSNAIIWTPNISIPQGGFAKFTFQATTNFPEAGSIHTNEVWTFGGNFETATNWTRMQAYTPTPQAVAQNDSYSTDEDVDLDVPARGVLDNDSNGDSASVVATPANGSLTLNSDGSFTYSPELNYEGSDDGDPDDIFRYEACASGGTCDTADVTIDIFPVEDAPIVEDDSYSVDEDNTLNVPAPGVLGNDSDPDAADTILYAYKTSDPPGDEHEITGFQEDGSFNYTPPADFFGEVKFTYEACDESSDPGQDCTGGTVTITVNPVNDPPVAEDDSGITDEDNAVTIKVLENDSDIEEDTLTVTDVTQPSNGSVSITDSGSTVTYTPDLNYFSDPDADSFTYTVSDGNGGEDTATVSVTVVPVNDPPVAVDDDAVTGQGTGPINILVLANDSDPVEGDRVLLDSISSAPSDGGDAQINENGTPDDASDDYIEYTPDPDFHHPTNPETFGYQICDDGTTDGNPDPKCDTAIVSVIVNDAPQAVDDAFSINEDTQLTVDPPGVLGNEGASEADSDPNGDSLTAVLVSGPSNASSFALNSDGSFTYQGDLHFNGEDSFTYKASDGGMESNEATVTITVNPVNDAPQAVADDATTDENAAIEIDVLDNDDDVDTGDVIRIRNDDDSEYPKSTAKLGTVNLDDRGTVDPSDDVLSYDPPADTFTTPGDPDTFTYTVCDRPQGHEDRLCDTATVSVTINGPPTANDDNNETNEDQTLNVAAPGVLDNDSDPNGDTLVANKLTNPSNGTLTAFNSDGSFSYEPDLNFNGSDSFTYEACDPRGLCDDATVTITVNPVNDPPVAVDDPETAGDYTIDEDTTLTVSNPGVLGNDTDVDNTVPDDLTALLETGPENGDLTLNADGSFTYDPDSDFNGTDTFTYRANDGTDSSVETATVTITVNPQPDDPTAVDDSADTQENTGTPINVLDNDFDVDGDAVLLDSVQSPTDKGGTAVINANGTPGDASDDFIDYTPPADFSSPSDPDTFTYTISDGTGRTDTATVSVTVNDPPSATDDSYSTDEDTTLSVAAPGVLDNDSDPNGDALQARKLSDPSNGALTLNSDGSFTYEPAADFNGEDSFAYEACDDLSVGLCDSATVTITVNAVNDAPVASDDSAITDMNVDIDIDVMADDSDVDGDTLRIKDEYPKTSAKGGTVTLDTNGTADPSDDVLNYDPPADTYTTPGDPDTFDYTVCDRPDGDPEQLCDTATVSVTINGPPSAVDDPSPTTDYTLDEDTSLSVAAPGVLDNDSDPNGDSLSVSQITDDVDNGTLSWSSDGSFDYTPVPDFYGSDGFTYEVCDPRGLCDTATASIQVNAVEDAPVAGDDSYSTDEDTTLSNPSPDLLANDSDADGDPLTVDTTPVEDVSNGSLTLNSDGTFTYDPDENFNGTDQFKYQVCDDTGRCDTAVVEITVEPVNDEPVANDDPGSGDPPIETDEDTSIRIDVLANDSDPDGDTLTVSDVTQPSNGSVSITDSGSTVTYSPDPNWYGDDSFTYTVSDGNGGSDAATVSVTVNPVNDAPVANDDSDSTGQDEPVTINVLGNDSDVEGDDLSVTTVTDPANGTATINIDDTITYQPDPGFSHPTDPDTFSYEICDDGTSGDPPTADSKCDSAAVSVIVNDPPSATNDAYEVDEDNTLSVSALGVLDNDSDPNDDTLAARKLSDPSDGTLTFNSDGSFTYEPDTNFNGSDSFSYEACDDLSGGLCDSATVAITVNSVNDPPEAQDDDKRGTPIEQGSSITIDVLANDSDVDGTLEPSTVQVVSGPSAGTTSVDLDDGSITYTHDGGPKTSDIFTYVVEDNEGEPSNEAEVSVAIKHPHLFVDISPSDAPASAGETVNFTVAFGNDGPGTAYDVEVSASVTSGCTLLSSNPIFAGDLAENGGGFEEISVEAPDSSGASCDVSVLITSSNGIGDGDTSTISVDGDGGSSSTSSEDEPTATPTPTNTPEPTATPTPTPTPDGSSFQSPGSAALVSQHPAGPGPGWILPNWLQRLLGLTG